MDDAIAIVMVSAWVVFGLYGWDLLVSLAGLLPFRLPEPREGQTADGSTRFAIVVCAHNEEAVVADVVESLRGLDYDADRRRIFVVADHCSDRTAEVARDAGAEVLERSGEEGRTKGYALRWGIERIREGGDFDALCVFDADNVVDPAFLSTMDRYLAAGHVAIQAYLDTKNPRASWVTRAIALAYFITNRFWMRARTRLGLSATLGGTGFCLAWPVVEKYGWDAGSLADDLELTMNLLVDRVRVTFCRHTRTYDEKPLTLVASVRQRTRWMQGQHDVAFRWFWRTLRAGISTSPAHAIRCIDAALYLIQPLRVLLAFGLLIALVTLKLAAPEHAGLVDVFDFTTAGLGVALAVFVVYPVILAALERAPPRLLLDIVPFLLFGFTWVWAIFFGLLRVRRRVWVHTPHEAAGSSEE